MAGRCPSRSLRNPCLLRIIMCTSIIRIRWVAVRRCSSESRATSRRNSIETSTLSVAMARTSTRVSCPLAELMSRCTPLGRTMRTQKRANHPQLTGE